MQQTRKSPLEMAPVPDKSSFPPPIKQAARSQPRPEQQANPNAALQQAQAIQQVQQ